MLASEWELYDESALSWVKKVYDNQAFAWVWIPGGNHQFQSGGDYLMILGKIVLVRKSLVS